MTKTGKARKEERRVTVPKEPVAEAGFDFLSPAERSERMSHIHSRDTGTELAVRRLVHGMGYRYRLHQRSLPGTPDIVFAGAKKVIFVHGCFWHLHKGCRQYRMPRARSAFWLPKLEENRRRDAQVLQRLAELGWRAMVVWECEVKDPAILSQRIRSFLEE